METIAVSEFRANLMSFLKKVEAGETITLTSRGHEVARLVPPKDKLHESRKALKKLSKSAIIGDVLSPIDEEWEAMK